MVAKNDWVSLIRAWGQNAIDDGPILMDTVGRESLFVAPLESLYAKENTEPLKLVDYDDIKYPPLVLVPLSGGMDSVIAYERAKDLDADVQAYYVVLNTPYRDAELHALDKLDIEYTVIDHSDWPARWTPYSTRWQHILPMRNLLIIASVARAEGLRPGQIWLGAVEGEIPPTKGDKSLKFFTAVQDILATYPIKHTLEFPLRYETKSDLVRWWIGSGRDPDMLLDTITCQSPQHGLPCGACHACFNRWVALTNNLLFEDTVVDPVSVPANQAKVTQFEIALAIKDFDTWSYRRIVQTLSAWYEATNSSKLREIEPMMDALE